jgi:hypothetical protein
MMVRSVDDFPRKILAFRSLQIAQHTRMKRDATPFLAGGGQCSIIDCQTSVMEELCPQIDGSSAEQ